MRLSRLFKAQEGTAAQRRRERGAAAVEFALIASVLMLLIFGGLQFGLILEMKNAVTQAASEGGRAAATTAYCYQNHCTDPAPSTFPSCSSPDGSGNDFGCVDAAAINQANATVGWMDSHLGVTCTSGGTVMNCQPTVIQCVDQNGHTTGHYCLIMNVTYSYSTQPYLPPIPLLSALLPSKIPATVTVQLNDPVN